VVREPIGVLGLGRMGSAVAHRLLADGAPLLLWNRTPARAEQAASANGRVAGSAGEVFERCAVVLVTVVDHAAVEEILRANVAGLAGRTIALLTDVTPAESARLSTLVTTAGGAYVEAQIYGSAEDVEARGVWVLVAGADAGSANAVVAALRNLGWVERLGPPPAASVLKISLLNLYLTMLSAVAASVALLDRRGIGPAAFAQITADREVFPPFVSDLARRMLARDFTRPINDLRGLDKDLAVLAAEFRDAGLPLGAELSAPLRRIVALAAENGRGAEDMCALVDLLQRGTAPDG
jgi:3-hydroxyisobutyrate dehydrogenase